MTIARPYFRRIAWSTATLVFIGCGTAIHRNPALLLLNGAALTRSEVTGAAAAALGSDGRFVFPTPPWASTSPERADSVALAAARVASGRRRSGDTVDHASLRPCGRRYYVLAVADSIPKRVYRPVRLKFGPRWVVPLCTPTGPSPLSVEVADGESALEIDPEGDFAGSWISEGEYGLLASDSGYDAGLPISPEQAVRFAVERTGRRATGLPAAIMIHPGSYGNKMPAKCMRWRIPLESRARFRGQHGEYEVAEVFVRRQRYCDGALVLQVADTQQPAFGTIEYPVFSAGGPERVTTEKATVRFALPVAYDSVSVIP